MLYDVKFSDLVYISNLLKISGFGQKEITEGHDPTYTWSLHEAQIEDRAKLNRPFFGLKRLRRLK